MGDFMAEEKSSTKSKTKEHKVHRGWLFGIIGALLLAGIVTLGCVLFKPIKPDGPSLKPTYTHAFFIYDDGKYTLWDAKGQRLSPDEYNDKSSFVGGYAYVKKGNEYALINDKGQLTVEFGRISEMKDYGAGLYLVKDNSSNELLMTGNGTVLIAGQDMTLSTSSTTGSFAVVKYNGAYYIYNYTGKLMAQYAMKDDADESPKLSSDSDFGLFHYDNFNLLFDNRTGAQIAAFEGDRYSFDSVSDDRTVILLEEYDDGKDYVLIRNGNLDVLDGLAGYGMINYTNAIVGWDEDYNIHLLDQNDHYKDVKTVASDLALKDNDNYATVNDNGEVVVVYRGQEVKNFGNEASMRSGVLAFADYYAIQSEGKYRFYRLDGSVAFGEYEDIYSVFGQHGHAMVSDDGEAYYFIDVNGKRISEATFAKAYAYDDSYVAYNADSKRAIFDANAVQLTGFDYSEASQRSVAVDYEIWSLKKEAGKYDVLDAKGHKMILTDVNVQDFYANYFTVKNDDGNIDYYTYDGAKFLTIEKNA